MICIPSAELVVVITLTLQGNGVRNQISEGVWDWYTQKLFLWTVFVYNDIHGYLQGFGGFVILSVHYSG